MLVPDDDFTAVLAAVRALREGGYEPWLAMSVPSAYAARSRATAGTVPVPDAGPDPEGFVAAMAEASERLRVAAVLPGTETSLTVLAGRGSDFPDSVVLGVPPREIVDRAVDKSLLAELALAAGLKVPETRTIAHADVDGISYPAVVKPVTSAVHGGGAVRLGWVRKIESPAELRAAVEWMPGDSLIVQPYLDGALSAACGVFWEGKLLCVEHQVARADLAARDRRLVVRGDGPARPRARRTHRCLAPGDRLERHLRAAVHPPARRRVRHRPEHALLRLAGAGRALRSQPARDLGRPPARPQAEDRRVPGRRPLPLGAARRAGDLHGFREGRRAEAVRACLPRPRTAHGIFSARDPLPFFCRLAGLKTAPGALPPAG